MQGFEPIQRHLRATRDELQERGLLLFIEALDCLEEPDHLWRLHGVAADACVSLKVSHIEVRQARDQKFKLLGIENSDQIFTNHVVEAAEESVYLSLDV